MSGYLMKDSITWKKNHVSRLLNSHGFFTKSLFTKGFKMIITAACEGPGRCAALEQNLAQSFQSCSRQIVSPAQKYGCFAVNWFRKIWKCKNSLSCQQDWIYDLLKISTLANWATQRDLWPHILSVLSGCVLEKKANKC